MNNSGFNTNEVSQLLEQAKSKLSNHRNLDSKILSDKIIANL
jgi:hypothetical protein